MLGPLKDPLILIEQRGVHHDAERALLDQRHYQKRPVLGGPHLRALLQPSGSSQQIPAYLPEALAPIILGYTFAFVAVVDMSAVAGLIAGGGLGSFAQTFGYRQYDPTVTWVCVLILVALVQVIQLLGNTLSSRILRR